MSAIDPRHISHPEELLEAFSLDALEEAEAVLVELHVESCSQCQQRVASYHQAMAELAQTPAQQAPPPSLRQRVLNSLPPQEGAPVVIPAVAPAYRPPASGRWSRLLLPLAAAITIGLFTTTLAMNLQLSTRMDQLEQENSTVTARLNQNIAEENQSNLRLASRMDTLERESATTASMLHEATNKDDEIVDSINQIRATNYLMADPATQPLILEPPTGDPQPQGVLLISNGGHRAILMVADMKQLDPAYTYRVWLVRQGNRLPIGEVLVDSAGWGITTLSPPESLFQFDWVNLTEERLPAPDTPAGDMVLRSRIATPNGSR